MSENPEIDPNTWTIELPKNSTTERTLQNEEWMDFSINDTGLFGYKNKQTKLNLAPTSHHINKSILGIVHLNIKSRTIKLLEDNIVGYLYHLA